MVILASYDSRICQYDILSAYTNASLPQLIVAHMPDNFRKEGKFLLVRKAFYGLLNQHYFDIAIFKLH